MKAVILAGGEGKRLKSVTGETPKPLVPLLGRSLMEHILLHAHLDEGQELTVVLKIGIALALNVAIEDLAGHLYTAAQVDIVLEALGEVEVTTDETDHLVLELTDFLAQGGILGTQLLEFIVLGGF